MYAIVDSSSKIHSLHETRESADDTGWGHDRELVELRQLHAVGDLIEYNERGVEVMARTAEAWWAWHDADSNRWSFTTEAAEERCSEWVAGISNDGPYVD
jgi:hypothetical protein